MNKRIAKKMNKKRKEYLRKNNILFLDKKKLKKIRKTRYSILNSDLPLHVGQKILLSNNFKDWVKMGIESKEEFLYFKNKKFITTVEKFEFFSTILIKKSYIENGRDTDKTLHSYWYIGPYMIQQL